MHVLYFTMGAQSLRAGRIVLSGPGVLIILAVTDLTREFLIGLNEAGHRCRQLSVGGGEGGIGPHQLYQHSIISVRISSEGVEIFVEISSRPGRTILLIFISFRCLPKYSMSGATWFLDSNGLIIDLGLPVICLVHIYP